MSEAEDTGKDAQGREEEAEGLTQAVRHLARLVAEHGLSELTVDEGGVSVTVRAVSEAAPVPLAAPASLGVLAHPHVLSAARTPAYSETAVTAAPAAPARAATTLALESPMVGVFYRSASPDDPPFVSVGDLVRVGQPIGLIEAMKVYSEIPSEIAGRVTEISAESGKLVQQGQPLIYVEPS